MNFLLKHTFWFIRAQVESEPRMMLIPLVCRPNWAQQGCRTTVLRWELVSDPSGGPVKTHPRFRFRRSGGGTVTCILTGSQVMSGPLACSTALSSIGVGEGAQV